jgi:hypothetical protein
MLPTSACIAGIGVLRLVFLVPRIQDMSNGQLLQLIKGLTSTKSY